MHILTSNSSYMLDLTCVEPNCVLFVLSKLKWNIKLLKLFIEQAFDSLSIVEIIKNKDNFLDWILQNKKKSL